MPKIFPALHLYAEKQHKFQQDKSKRFISGWEDDPTLSLGDCVPLALHWLDAKIHNRDPFDSGVRFNDVHEQNAAIMLSHESVHGMYGTNDILCLRLINSSSFQLRLSREDQFITATNRKVSFEAINGAIHRLARGTGVIILFHARIDARGLRGAHAVALFLDRMGQLFYFDANCGEYKLLLVSGFFFELLDIYNAEFREERQAYYVKAR